MRTLFLFFCSRFFCFLVHRHIHHHHGRGNHRPKEILLVDRAASVVVEEVDALGRVPPGACKGKRLDQARARGPRVVRDAVVHGAPGPVHEQAGDRGKVHERETAGTKGDEQRRWAVAVRPGKNGHRDEA